MESTKTKMKITDPYVVWTAFSVLTLVYGLALAALQSGFEGIVSAFADQWVIWTGPALLLTDYIAMVGIAPAFVNAGVVGLLSIVVLALAKQPMSGPQMGALSLIIGIGFFGKNPANMIPILIGAWFYALYKREPYKNHVTVALFASTLGPVVSQPAHTPEIVAVLGGFAPVLGALLGLFMGFVVNSMGAFIRKSHEGLNLYNIGWGAGLLAVMLTLVYNALGIADVRLSTPSWTIGGSYATGVLANPYVGMYGRCGGYYNDVLYIFLFINLAFFAVFGWLGVRESDQKINLKELLYMKTENNIFYDSHGPGYTYLAMVALTVLTLAITWPFGVHMNGAIYGAAISMIGWAGFGKAVFTCVIIMVGILLAAILRFMLVPGLMLPNLDGISMSFLEFYTTQSVIWVSAFFATCLSPMVKYFRWKRGILVGMMHFLLVFGTADLHWGQHLYNNGFAAGLVCLVLIPIFRAFDRKGEFPPRAV